MTKGSLYVLILLISLLIFSCSKRTHPSKSSSTIITKNAESPPVTKTAAKRKAATPLPKVIVVNDTAAHKSVDGRFYYDVMGHRYWRNNKDGKYYLFNKSMFSDPDFKAPLVN